MDTAKIFENGRSQAVRLPKEYRFSSDDVFIKKIDDVVMLIPKDKVCKIFHESIDKFSDDIVFSRDQEIPQTRESFQMQFILDTNICIYILNKKYRKIMDKVEAQGIEEIGLSTMTVAELALGVEKSTKKEANKIALMEFLLPFKILNFNQNDAYTYAKIRSDLETQGNIIGNMDLLIGAQPPVSTQISPGVKLIQFLQSTRFMEIP